MRRIVNSARESLEATSSPGDIVVWVIAIAVLLAAFGGLLGGPGERYQKTIETAGRAVTHKPADSTGD